MAQVAECFHFPPEAVHLLLLLNTIAMPDLHALDNGVDASELCLIRGPICSLPKLFAPLDLHIQAQYQTCVVRSNSRATFDKRFSKPAA